MTKQISNQANSEKVRQRNVRQKVISYLVALFFSAYPLHMEPIQVKIDIQVNVALPSSALGKTKS